MKKLKLWIIDGESEATKVSIFTEALKSVPENFIYNFLELQWQMSGKFLRLHFIRLDI